MLNTHLARALQTTVIALAAIIGLAASANAAALVETPSLADPVKSGTVPAIEKRVPENPLVVPLDKDGLAVGKPGGTIDMLFGRAKDIRMMVVYGYARLVGYDKSFNIVPDIVETCGVKK